MDARSAWRPCYIFANVFFNIFYGRLILRPWWTEVRESFTRGGPWVWLEQLLLGFFPGHPYTTGWAKKWRNLAYIFRPRPQTFCSDARTRQNIVILKKKLVKHRWLIRVPRFRELWPTNPRDQRATKFLKTTCVNSLRHVLFPFTRCQHDYARTP